MSRKKKILRNLIILVILFFIFLKSTGLYLSPISAHKSSERSIHYGPSEIVHIEDFSRGKYILCKYNGWVSCNTVEKKFFFWTYGDQVIGLENDQTKPVDYTWSMAGGAYKLYGIVNDDKVKKVEITLDNGEIFTQTEFYEDLFLFHWESSREKGGGFNNIKAYDIDGNVIFQSQY